MPGICKKTLGISIAIAVSPLTKEEIDQITKTRILESASQYCLEVPSFFPFL
jgi:hypothetical protein